jgi:hypothetical protein
MEEEKRRRNNECYNCGKSGHYSARCPMKKPYYDRRTYRAAETTVGEASAEDESGKEDPCVMGQLWTGAGSRELVTGWETTQEQGLGIRSIGWGRAGPESRGVR